MYTGHVGIALALRGQRGAPPLWLLVLAAQGPDWGDLVRVLFGGGYMAPGWSPHSFVFIGVGAAIAALVARRLTRGADGGRGRAMLLAALAYASHWLADYFTGIKPTWPGGPEVGLGLYFQWKRDLLLESAVVAIGWWLWRRSLTPRPGLLAVALLAALVGLQLLADLMIARGAGIL